MSGRGRPRKARSPDTKCAKSKGTPEEAKPVSQPRCRGKYFTEEKQNDTTKEPKPKETKKQQSTTTNNTKAPVEATKAKTCAGRAKTTLQTAAVIKTQPEGPKDITKVTVKATKAETCAAKAKLPGKIPETTTKMQPVTPKDTKKACVPEGKVDSILYTTLDKLKIKRDERSDAAKVVNKIVDTIIVHLKENTLCFKEVEPLRTGSYYENLKISNPDEFDVMLTFPVDRVKINPFGDDGAFYSVELKRGTNPLEKFQKTSTTLSASEMLKDFRDEVKKCVKQFTEWEVTRKKKGCPAVTLTTKVQSITISLDVVLGISVKSSWPPFTNEGIKIDGWLGAKVKQEFKRMPYYLVPKFEGRGDRECDGVLAKDCWRISFSHVEKAILKNHGSQKTCCEKGGERCCRKDCLKLLKHLLSLLKEEDSSFDKFCSYHAKTTFLHACCMRTKDSDWKASSLSHCFQLLLHDFEAHLKAGVLNNVFIPTQNLLSGPGVKKCNTLALRIREELDKGVPIFK